MLSREELRRSMLLYAVTDRMWLNDSALTDAVRAALDGGITFLQIREKDLDHPLFLQEAAALQQLAKEYDVPFVINDDVELAHALNADGVHIGQNDTALCEARKLLGPDKIIGVSVHTAEQAAEAEKNGADYLGAGAVFMTSTKQDAKPLCMETITSICHAVAIPVVGIGGLSADNIPLLWNTGLAGAAVVSAIFASNDIRQASYELLTICKETFL